MNSDITGEAGPLNALLDLDGEIFLMDEEFWKAVNKHIGE